MYILCRHFDHEVVNISITFSCKLLIQFNLIYLFASRDEVHSISAHSA